MAKVIAVINRKGGTGKTTSTVNLASRIAELVRPEGKRVLIIDLDPQGHAGAALGVRSEGRCVGDLLLGEVAFKEVVVSADRSADDGPSRPNLFLIPASSRLLDKLRKLDRQIAFDYLDARGGYEGPLMGNILDYFLDGVRPYFSHIFLDCPPSLGHLNDAVYDFADTAIVPVKMAYLDASGARQHIDDIIGAQSKGIDIQVEKVVPTFFRPRELVARSMMESLVAKYKRAVATPIPQSSVIEKSQAAGQQTLFEYAPDSVAAKVYDKLAREVM